MRNLVTGGCGFIGLHFARRFAPAGDEVVVLDKLTYSGIGAQSRGRAARVVRGDVADAVTATGAAEGCKAIGTSPPRQTWTAHRRCRELITTDVSGTHVLLQFARVAGIRFAEVSTDEVYGDMPEGDWLPKPSPATLEPLFRVEGGADLQVLAYVRTYGRNASITRDSNAYGPTSPREADSTVRYERARRRAAACVRGRPPAPRVAARGDHCAAVELVLREGEPGAVDNAGGEEHDNLEAASGSSSSRARPLRSSGTSTTVPATIAATRSTPRGSALSVGAQSGPLRTALPRLLPGISTSGTGGSRSSEVSTPTIEAPVRKAPALIAGVAQFMLSVPGPATFLPKGSWKARGDDSPSRSPFWSRSPRCGCRGAPRLRAQGPRLGLRRPVERNTECSGVRPVARTTSRSSASTTTGPMSATRVRGGSRAARRRAGSVTLHSSESFKVGDKTLAGSRMDSSRQRGQARVVGKGKFDSPVTAKPGNGFLRITGFAIAATSRTTTRAAARRRQRRRAAGLPLLRRSA